MPTTLTARNATAQDLLAILNEQQAAKNDVVVPSTNMKMVSGLLVVRNSEAVLSDTGVTTVNGTYRPTDVFDDGVSDKLGIPRQYLRKLRTERPDMYDQTVNGWLHGRSRRTAEGTEVIYPADPRAHLLRLFRGEGEGVARAMLSDRYALSMDNLDVLTAVMTGIRDSGMHVISRVSDLSERGMRVRFECPDIVTESPKLLDGYRSPFDGNGAVPRAGAFDQLRQQYGAHHMFERGAEPLVFMGFDLTNNETGGGALILNPVAIMLRCTNGLTIRREGIRRVHLGAKMSEGIRPSADTLQKTGALITAETRDAVQQWLTPDYLRQLVAGLEEKAGAPVTSITETVPAICAGLGFTPDEQKGVLDLFARGGQSTAGGVAQAVSAYAQTVEDVDRAYAIELRAVEAMEIAAR
jgi:hypothetical protein